MVGKSLLCECVRSARLEAASGFSLTSILKRPTFEVHNKHTERTLTYTWWTRKQLEAEGAIKLGNARAED